MLSKNIIGIPSIYYSGKRRNWRIMQSTWAASSCCTDKRLICYQNVILFFFFFFSSFFYINVFSSSLPKINRIFGLINIIDSKRIQLSGTCSCFKYFVEDIPFSKLFRGGLVMLQLINCIDSMNLHHYHLRLNDA